MKRLIVSRHAAAIEFVRAECPEFNDAEVMASVGPSDVQGADVVGNLPLSLAALCGRYRAIEFSGPPPRGGEYGLAEMRAAGAALVDYTVIRGATHDVATRLVDNGLDVYEVRELFPHLR